MEQEKLLYEVLEVQYLKAMGREVTIDVTANADLYPMNWYSNKNYKKKIEILMEAIDSKVAIRNTSAYTQICEGIRNPRNR